MPCMNMLMPFFFQWKTLSSVKSSLPPQLLPFLVHCGMCPPPIPSLSPSSHLLTPSPKLLRLLPLKASSSLKHRDDKRPAAEKKQASKQARKAADRGPPVRCDAGWQIRAARNNKEALTLKSQVPQDLIRHILKLPRISRHPLELNPM